MTKRHEVYNETLRYLDEEEKKGNVFIIRPTEKLDVGRVERNPKKLTALYDQGYKEANRIGKQLQEFLIE